MSFVQIHHEQVFSSVSQINIHCLTQILYTLVPLDIEVSSCFLLTQRFFSYKYYFCTIFHLFSCATNRLYIVIHKEIGRLVYRTVSGASKTHSIPLSNPNKRTSKIKQKQERTFYPNKAQLQEETFHKLKIGVSFTYITRANAVIRLARHVSNRTGNCTPSQCTGYYLSEAMSFPTLIAHF